MHRIAVILLLLLSGCVGSDPIHWTEEMIRGVDFNSRSDTGVLRMSFPADGNYVVTTIGDRNGDVAGPVYEWQINKAGRLVFIEDGNELDEFKLIRYSSDEVEVKHSSQGKVLYRRSPKVNPDGEQGGDLKPDHVSS